MKILSCIPGPVLRSIERLAEKLGVSRSELWCRAMKDLFERNEQVGITARLNKVYGAPGAISSLEPRLAAMQVRSIGRRGTS